MDTKNVNFFLFFLLAALSMLSIVNANKNVPVQPQHWGYGYNYTDWYNKYHSDSGVSKKITVGGSSNWQFGVNYTDWALKTGPFYLNDTLVFKYALPADNTSHPHSVYLLPDYWSFMKCDLSRAWRVANWTQGSGEGFEFRLMTWRPHYFACGEANGIHCDLGLMKFIVKPIFHRPHNW